MEEYEKNENQASQATEETEVEVVELRPLVNVIEQSDALILTCEVPGVNSKSVDVRVTNRVLHVKATSWLKRDDDTVVYKREFQLSDDIDVEKIGAKVQDGILTITLPKSEQAKVHQVIVE